MHLRRNSSLNVYNSVFTGWPYGLRATDKKGTANDGIAVKNVIFAGMWKNFYDDEKVSENFFNRAGNNTTLATTNEIISKDGVQFMLPCCLLCLFFCRCFCRTRSRIC